MKTSIGFRLTAVILVAIMFIGGVSVSVHADDASAKAQKARDAVDKAKKLAEKCKELQDAADAAQKAADDAQAAANAAKKAADKAQAIADNAKNSAAGSSSSMGSTPEDEAAKTAAAEADRAAAEADKAKADAQKAQKAADDAAKNGKGGAKSKEQKAADAAKEKADAAEDTAKRTEDTADAADRKAADADSKSGGDSKGDKSTARAKRKGARGAARAAAAAKREADAKQAEADDLQAAADAAKAAARQPCDDAEKAKKAADDAIGLAEEAIDKKIRGSGNKPPKKDVKDKEDLDKLKKDFEQQNGTTAKEPAKSVEPPKPGITIEPEAENVRTKTANGLQTVTFDMLQGTVTVNLPDDIRAGDTLSGTVFTEPKGNTPEEKAVNQKVLNATILDLAGTRIQGGGDDPRFTWTPLMPQPQMPVQYRLRIVEILGNPTPMTQSGAVITPNPTTAPSGVMVTPDPKMPQKFNIPDLGQTGRNILITGPFDGNSSNTDATIQPSAAPAANLQILAESHGMAVLRSSTNLTGPMRLSVNDGTTMTTSIFRNVDVNLSAPKTNLLKGDSTTLTVRFRGLQGIKRDVSFRLEKSGVVTMQGGDVQTRSIKPSEVQADGSFMMTRTMTGTQAGAFSVTATVIVE